MARTDEGRTGQHWDIKHPVIEVLRHRRLGGYVPGSMDDGHKVGLAVEGGGMRGIVSAAMITAIEDLGLTHAFDAVYAASSGATNAAYFLAGNSWYQLSIYYDDLSTGQFIDFGRILRRRPILDLDYVFDDVIHRLKKLDIDRVLASPVRLHVGVTVVDEMRCVDVSEFQDHSDFLETLRATTWLPIALPGTAAWRGQRALDGGVLVAHPFRGALSDGCTHVLSISTRPIGPPRARHTVPQRVVQRHLDNIRPGLGDGYLAAVRQHWADRRTFVRQRQTPTQAPYVLDLAPLPWMAEIKRHDVDLGRLLRAAREAYAVAVCAFEQIPTAEIATEQVRVIPRLTLVREGMLDTAVRQLTPRPEG